MICGVFLLGLFWSEMPQIGQGLNSFLASRAKVYFKNMRGRGEIAHALDRRKFGGWRSGRERLKTIILLIKTLRKVPFVLFVTSIRSGCRRRFVSTNLDLVRNAFYLVQDVRGSVDQVQYSKLRWEGRGQNQIC